MKETLKRIKADIIVSALLCIALGIVLLVWPAETIDVFCKILAVGLIIMGGVDIASYFIVNRNLDFPAPGEHCEPDPDCDRRDPLRTWNPGSEACDRNEAQRL